MDVIRGLEACEEWWWVADNYISYHHPSKHGEYHFKERVPLNVAEGNIFIDLLIDESIGGIEFELNDTSRTCKKKTDLD
ncbi:MAG: hypothetical protein AAGA64_13680 [Bacteroidota bacterium]